MVFDLFRRKKSGKPSLRPGREKGVFLLEQVFELGSRPLSFLVLAGRLVRGEMRVGDLLGLPDGRLLRVEAIEASHKRVELAPQGRPIGVRISGIEWRPRRSDFKDYVAGRVLEKVRRETVERLSRRMPREAAERLAEDEIAKRLESIAESVGLKVYEAVSAG